MAERDDSDELHSDKIAHRLAFVRCAIIILLLSNLLTFFSLFSFRVPLICCMLFHQDMVKISSRNIEGNGSCGRSDMCGPVWRARRVIPPLSWVSLPIASKH